MRVTGHHGVNVLSCAVLHNLAQWDLHFQSANLAGVLKFSYPI